MKRSEGELQSGRVKMYLEVGGVLNQQEAEERLQVTNLASSVSLLRSRFGMHIIEDRGDYKLPDDQVGYAP